MTSTVGPVTGPEDRERLESRLDLRREQMWSSLSKITVRRHRSFFYVDGHMPSGDVQRLLRLRWEGGPDEWAMAVWNEPTERYQTLAASPQGGRLAPEGALDAACENYFGVPSTQRVSHDDFCVYRRDFLFKRLEPWVERHRVYTVGATYAAVLIAIKALLALFSGGLTTPTLGTDLSVDLTRFPPYRLLTTPLGLSTSQVSSSAIPYLRDHADLLVTVFLAFNLAILQKQWYHISTFTRRLWRLQALRKDPAFYRSFQERCEGQFNSWYSYALCLVGAFALTFGILFVLTNEGMYSALNPGRGRQWELSASQSWWANPEHGLLPFLFQVAWLLTMTYYVLRQNVVGVLAVRNGRELLRKQTEPVLNVTPSNCGDVLELLRSLLVSIYASIILTTASLMMLYFILPSGAARALVVPLLLICLICNPLYVFVPWQLLNTQLAHSVETARVNIRREQEKAIAVGDDASARRLELRDKDYAVIPLKVFPNWRAGSVVGVLIGLAVPFFERLYD